jgi:sugar phosphate isomerase/epimerase
MIPCLSLVTLCETETPKAIEAAARAGFSHVEFWWPRLKPQLQSGGLEAIQTALQENEIVPIGMAGLGLELAGSDELWRESLARAADAFAAIAPLHLPLITFTPGLVHEAPHQGHYGLALDRLAVLTDMAAAHQLQLALEVRSDSRWLTSLDTAAAIVSQLGSDRLGLCLDLFHFYLGPGKFEDLNKIVVGLLKSVQLSDLIGTPRELAKDSDRIFPGEGDFDPATLLKRLQKLQFPGLVTVEVPNPNLWQIPADRVSDMACQSLGRLWPMTTSQA